MSDLKNRKGKFTISCVLLDKQPDSLLPLFAQMIITRAECNWIANRIEYLAMSPLFEVLEEVQEIPEYLIKFDYSNPSIVKAERVHPMYVANLTKEQLARINPSPGKITPINEVVFEEPTVCQKGCIGVCICL